MAFRQLCSLRIVYWPRPPTAPFHLQAEKETSEVWFPGIVSPNSRRAVRNAKHFFLRAKACNHQQPHVRFWHQARHSVRQTCLISLYVIKKTMFLNSTEGRHTGGSAHIQWVIEPSQPSSKSIRLPVIYVKSRHFQPRAKAEAATEHSAAAAHFRTIPHLARCSTMTHAHTHL